MHAVDKKVFIELVRGYARLYKNSAIRTAIELDQYLFATYISCMITFLGEPPGLKLEEYARKVNLGELESHEDFRKLFRDLQHQFGDEVTSQYALTFAQSLAVYLEFSQNPNVASKAFLWWNKKANEIAEDCVSSIDENVFRLTKLLKLTNAEAKILTAAILMQGDVTLRIFFESLNKIYGKRGEITIITLASMFDLEEAEVLNALSEESTLARSGLLTYNSVAKRISPPSSWLNTAIGVVADSDVKFFERFVKRYVPTAAPGALARANEQDERLIKEILEANGEDGINVLCYGPRQIDKENYLAKLVKELEYTPWIIQTKQVPVGDMPTVCYIAQRYLEKHHEYDVLLVPRASDVLTRGRSKTKMWLIDEGLSEDNDELKRDHDEVMLLNNPVKTLWIAHRNNSISEDNVSRFLFHCELRGATRHDRRVEIETILKEFNLSPELTLELAKHKGLGREQLRSAARLAELIADEEDASLEPAEIVKRAIDRSQKALGRDEVEELRESVTKYSLDYLNIAGKFTPQQIVKALKLRPKGTLCFWGLPGAGKTQLAEYLAVELDMPIVMKRASDLLSKWLGENEQNIRNMFVEAEEEGAILFLDEADSFLRDRSTARHSWEVSSVNELLQQMERFKGIFICATNLFESIDAAALRRFTFKLEFRALDYNQRWQMFLNETGAKEEQFSEHERESLHTALSMIRYLTPGDFATVRRQANLLGETLTLEDWLKQLQLESEAKLQGIQRNDYRRAEG